MSGCKFPVAALSHRQLPASEAQRLHFFMPGNGATFKPGATASKQVQPGPQVEDSCWRLGHSGFQITTRNKARTWDGSAF